MSYKIISLISLSIALSSCSTPQPKKLSLGVEAEREVVQIAAENSAANLVLIERAGIANFESELPDVCDFEAIDALGLNDDEVEWVGYQNESKGLAVKLPYNPEWGMEAYQIEPFAEINDAVFFGAITVRGEGCGSWVSGNQQLNFLPIETKDEVLERLQVESDALEFGYEIKSLTVGGIEVVEYSKDGLCGGGGTIIIGEKSNYELATTCGPNTREDLIESMEFI